MSRNTNWRIAAPVAPVLPVEPDGWRGDVAPELHLEDCVVTAEDFSAAHVLRTDGCSLSAVMLANAKLEKLQLTDTVIDHCEAAGLQAPGAVGVRIVVKNSRLTGADFGRAVLDDCTLEGLKLDEANLRFTACKRVVFRDCILRNADFTSARLTHVSFVRCDLEGAIFDRATCMSVDLRGEKLAGIKGIAGLKGTRILPEQLIELAPLLAQEVGLDVEYAS